MPSIGRMPPPKPPDEGRDQLAAIRGDMVAEMLRANPLAPKPGIFADAVTMGLQRPVAGVAAAMDFWNHPGTSMSERYEGGKEAYSDALRQQVEEAGPGSALAQSLAGSLVMGGPSGSLWKQAAFDAGTGGVQSLASGESLTDAAGNAAMNAGMGGVLNAGAKGKGILDERQQLVEQMLRLARQGGL